MRSTMTDARVVVENRRRAAAVAQTAALEGAGFSVTHCGGPPTLPGGQCPLVADGWCPWIETADVVVHDLDLDTPEDRAVLRTLQDRRRDTPVVLELPAGTAREHASLLQGCHVVYPFDMDRLVDAVSAALPSATPPRTPSDSSPS